MLIDMLQKYFRDKTGKVLKMNIKRENGKIDLEAYFPAQFNQSADICAGFLQGVVNSGKTCFVNDCVVNSGYFRSHIGSNLALTLISLCKEAGILEIKGKLPRQSLNDSIHRTAGLFWQSLGAEFKEREEFTIQVEKVPFRNRPENEISEVDFNNQLEIIRLRAENRQLGKVIKDLDESLNRERNRSLFERIKEGIRILMFNLFAIIVYPFFLVINGIRAFFRNRKTRSDKDPQ